MNDEKIFKEYVEQIIQSVLYTASLRRARAALQERHEG